MAKEYDALVLGSGMGGIAAALLLAHRGKKVIVFEKNDRPGGRFSSFSRDGFTMDLGVHVISRGAKGPVISVLESTGIQSDIEWIKVRPQSSTRGKLFSFPHDLKEMVPAEDFDAVIKFVGDVKGLSEDEIEALDPYTLEQYLNRYTKNELIHTCVSRIGSVYVGVPEWITSAGEFARCMQWEALSRSSAYPAGGCMAVTNAYIKGIEQFGGELLLNATVEKVLVEDGKAVGALVNGEEYRAPLVVSNADIRHTVLDLTGPEHFPADYVEYIRGLKYSFCSPVVRIGLNKVINDEIKMTGQFYPESQHKYYEMMERRELPDELNLFLVVPSNFDPGTAPEGKQLVMIASPIIPGMDDEFADKFMEGMIDTAEKFLPGLRENALFINKTYPSQMRSYGGENGATIGIAQTPGQVGKSRPKIKTPLEGLYIVGCEAGGAGVGTELAANSAMEFIAKYIDQ